MIADYFVSTEALFRFTQTSYSQREDLSPLIGGIILDTTGEIDQDITVVVRTVPGSGTATGKVLILVPLKVIAVSLTQSKSEVEVIAETF